MLDTVAIEAAAHAEDAEIALILADVCRITKMGFAAVARVTEQRWIACQVLDQIAFGLEAEGELAIETTICDEIRRSGLAVVIGDVANDPKWFAHPTPAMYGFKSYVSLPLFLGDGMFCGTLCAIDPDPRELGSPALIGALERHATRIAVILSGRPLLH